MHGVMRHRFTLYAIVAICSVVLSILAAIKTAVINPDAICYLGSAEAMTQGLSSAIHLCDQAKWPFYSFLIFSIHKLFQLNVIYSAYLLDGFFSLLTAMVFVAVIQILSCSKRVAWLAVVVVLLAHGWNSLRPEIIRDHGFWAFYLLSLFFMLCYFQDFVAKKTLRGCYAVLWNVSVFIAGLFRIEGFIFLMLLPLVTCFMPQRNFREKSRAFFQLYALPLLGAAALLIWSCIHPDRFLGRLPEIQLQLLHGVHELAQAFQNTKQNLAQHVLNFYAAHDAGKIAVLMFIGWYLLNVVSGLSVIYSILVVYAWLTKAAKLQRSENAILWAYIIINVLITGVFLVENLFLAKRYVIALSLVLMLWVPFALENLCAQYRIRKWPIWLALMTMLIYGLGNLFNFGHSKQFVRDGGDWLAQHAAPAAKIYSNDYQLLYYSHHLGDAIFTEGKKYKDLATIAHNKWQQYDFIALHIDLNTLTQVQAILQEMKLTPAVIFTNDRGDQIRIYQIHTN